MDDDPSLLFRVAGFTVAAALFWLLYFDQKDRLQREPRRLLLASFALGLGSAALGVILFRLVEALGLWGLDGDPLETALHCIALAGPIEEGVKFLVLRAVIVRFREFDEPVDGLVYASAVALGFATLENLLYLPYMPWEQGLVRALASPLTHSVFAAVWGFGVAHALLVSRTPAARFAWQAGPLLAAMLLHGVYDYALLVHDATLPAAAIVLVLWIFLIWYAHRLTRTPAATAE